MASLFTFVLRLLLLAAGLVFALSLACVLLVLLALWGLRAAWARLTGRPVQPFVMRFGPRAAFEQMMRRAPPSPAAAASRTPRADAAAHGANARWTREVTDVDPK